MLTTVKSPHQNNPVNWLPRRPVVAWGALIVYLGSVLLAWLEFAHRPASLEYSSAESLEFVTYVLLADQLASSAVEARIAAS